MAEPGSGWQPLPESATAALATDGLSVSEVTGLDEHLVSGDLAEAAAAFGVDATGVGALGLACGARYAVRLARDRMLVVGASPDAPRPGWHAEGFAVSDVGGGSAVFVFEGAKVGEIVARATSLPLTGPSPSAAVVFAGVAGTLYRHDRPERLRLHVDRGHAAFVWQWLEAVLPQLSG
jgi:sarcosine oxidase gamma subunit